MTEAEIAAASGGTVSSRMVRGVRVLSGTGVLYGGARPDSTDTRIWNRPAEQDATTAASVAAPSAEPPASSSAPTTSEPPPYVPQHRGILATPPGLL